MPSSSNSPNSSGSRYIVWRTLLVLFLSILFVIPVTIFLNDNRIANTPIWPLPEDPVDARKARLINHLLPAIQQNNRVLLKQRNKVARLLERAKEQKSWRKRDIKWLTQQGERYRLPASQSPDTPPDIAWLTLLLRRVDMIPADLALAQAALESAWGESRFAIEGSNYFGQWCFSDGCGMVPAQRPAGASYEVETFDSINDSVERYMLNLNSHPRYSELRQLRESARKEMRAIDGQELAAGLHGYSAIGNTYIRTLRAMIRANDFSRFNSQ